MQKNIKQNLNQSLLDKIRDGKISLADAKKYQAEFKSNLTEIKKGNKKQIKQAKKMYCIILKCLQRKEQCQ